MAKKKLIDYDKNATAVAKVASEGVEYEPSGIKSPECEEGEMMIIKPELHHPEIKGLRRAICSSTGWRGWV